IVVLSSPVRLTERTPAMPGVAATCCSIFSATTRETSSADAPLYTVRIVSTGRVTSGRSETGICEIDTAPRRTRVRVAAMVVTGRRRAAELSDMDQRLSGLVAGLLRHHPDRRLVTERQVVGGEDHVAGLQRNHAGGAVGEDLRFAAVGAPGVDVDPFRLAIDCDEDERPVVAFDHGACRDDDA